VSQRGLKTQFTLRGLSDEKTGRRVFQNMKLGPPHEPGVLRSPLKPLTSGGEMDLKELLLQSTHGNHLFLAAHSRLAVVIEPTQDDLALAQWPDAGGSECKRALIVRLRMSV
jgi:hypothetical protein